MLSEELIEMIKGDCLVRRKINEPMRDIDQRRFGAVFFADLLDDFYGIGCDRAFDADVASQVITWRILG